jgi:Flp pilus assembly protein TadB
MVLTSRRRRREQHTPRQYIEPACALDFEKCERRRAMKYAFLVVAASVMALSTNASGQGDEKREKPEKVTSAMMQEKTADTTHREAGHVGDTQAAKDTAAERDFDTIRAGVKSSTAFIVVKALALAVAIIGLGVVYMPRKAGGSS